MRNQIPAPAAPPIVHTYIAELFATIGSCPEVPEGVPLTLVQLVYVTVPVVVAAVAPVFTLVKIASCPVTGAFGMVIVTAFPPINV